MILAEIADKMPPLALVVGFDCAVAAIFFFLTRKIPLLALLFLPFSLWWVWASVDEMLLGPFSEEFRAEMGLTYTLISAAADVQPLVAILSAVTLAICAVFARRQTPTPPSP